MNIVAKIKCQCGTWVRIRDHRIPTSSVLCWKCNAELWLSWVNRSGGTGKIRFENKETTTNKIQIESLELP